MAAKTLSSTSNSYSFSNMKINEDDWVKNMRESIVEHKEEEDKVPVCIFTVPQVLRATNPESYIPQQVALGPFHHWRPEVYDMQRYKLAAARRTQKHMNVSFERIVETMKKKDEAQIRACYHKFLDMSPDALIWLMAVDMAFLLEFLQVYSMKEGGRILKKVTSSMSHLVDVTGKKLSHMAILRDLVMVENQIPLFLIKTMLEHQCRNTNQSAVETLKSMLKGLYQELSPFQEKELADVVVNDCDHLLDFLYHMTVPNNKELGIMEAEIDIEEEDDITMVNDEEGKKSFVKQTDLQRFMGFLWNIICKLNAGLVKLFKKIFRKPMALLKKLPWKMLSDFPIINLMGDPMGCILERFQGNEKEKLEDHNNGEPKAPTMEEITIPSVTEMVEAGILFSPVNGGIYDISFDNITSTLYLPVVDLDVNSEVYLRNLVAYEACVAAGPLVMARYTELMNGIIDTEEDAKYLRERGIVVNHLKSDKEVADLWNGMSRSVKMTKVAKMDKVIEDVNKRYGRTWKGKMENFLNKYVFGSWKFLTVFAALFMLLLTGLEAFCSVYDCPQVFHIRGGDSEGN